MTKEISIIPIAKKRLNIVLEENGISKIKVDALIKKHKDIKVIDNDSLLIAKAAKMEFVKCRTSGTPVFKNFRDPLNEASKWVVKEENEYKAHIAIGEDPISAQIDAYEAILKAEQDAIEEAQRKEFVNRKNQLTALGAMEDADTKEMVLDTVKWSMRDIETFEIENFWTILNEFKEKNVELATEEENKLKKQHLHNTRLNELHPYWAFLSEETRTSNLADLSDDDFGALLTIGIAEKAEFDKQKAAIEVQKTAIKKQTYDFRAIKIKDLGYTIGDVAITGFDKQISLNILDNELCSSENFDSDYTKMKEFSDGYAEKIELHAKKLAEVERRINEIRNLGFKDLGTKELIFDGKITVSRIMIESAENFDAYIENQKESIDAHEKEKQRLKKEQDLEAENALSDEDKYNRFINAIFDVEKPVLKSKKYAKKLDDAYKLIEQIKNL